MTDINTFTAISGKTGLFGDPVYAFDGQFNNGGYWAGEENGVNLGTAWVGADFASTPVRPREVAITARSGYNRYQAPTAFYLQARDSDDDRWINIQHVVNIGEFSSNETKLFEIYDGFYPATPTIGDGNTSGNRYLSANQVIGQELYFHSRMRVEQVGLRLYCPDTTDVKIGIFRNRSGTKGDIYADPVIHTVTGSASFQTIIVDLPDYIHFDVDSSILLEIQPNQNIRICLLYTSDAADE